MANDLSRVMQIRRHQPTRLEGFVDASFAFAVTLVIISIGHVPASVDEMLTALRGLPTFAVCFLLIARIWLSHREWSRCYDLEDSTGVSLSLLLVFIVLIYVYPLRMLFAQMFMGFSGGGLSDGSVRQLATVEELRAAYLVFGLGFAAISAVFVLLFRHALRHADAIGLAPAERAYTRMKIGTWATQAALALASIALACCLPALVRA
ncbi:TMEM175 family protein, partial [Rudaea sp.]|uniref:TMEM175 family protein n=1 Tax=Rudaea sp. TaxID=2136325 RepID=UPI002ED661FA